MKKFKFKFDKNISNKFIKPTKDKLNDPLNLNLTKSWFNNTFYSFKDNSLHNNIKIKNNVKNDQDIERVKIIKLYPSKKQKKIFNTWFFLFECTYNKTIKYLRNDHKIEFNKLVKIIKNELKQDKYVNDLITKYKIPSHTLNGAINDAHKALRSALTNKKNGNIQKFKLRFIKSGKLKRSLFLENTCFQSYKEEEKQQKRKNKEKKIIKKNSFCTQVLGDFIKSDYPLSGIKTKARLVLNKNEYYLHVFENKKTKKNNNMSEIISLDPGLRTFLTGYTLDGVQEIGSDIQERIMKYLKKIRELEKAKIIRNEKTYFRYLKFLRTKIKNLISELHLKTCNELCTKYKTILIGKLSTKGIVKRNKSKLSTLQKDFCHSLRHYDFREKLTNKCEELGVRLIKLDEHETTITCCNCGNKKEPFKSKVYNCEKCKIKMDRDHNSALNMILKIGKELI